MPTSPDRHARSSPGRLTADATGEAARQPPTTGGDPMVAAGIGTTDRRSTEAELRELQHLLARVSDALYVFDADSLRFTWVNDGALRQSGYSRAQLLDMNAAELFDDLDIDHVRGSLAARVASPAEPLELPLAMRTKDGDRLRVEGRIDATTSAEHAPRFVAFVHDVGHLLATERLATLVAERERIARDLHDTVVQDLFGTGLALQALSMRVSAEQRGRLEELVERLDRTIREVRTAIFSLSSRRHDASLSASLLDVVDDSARALGFRPVIRFEGPIDSATPASVDEHVLATLREALSNVARHAAADRVEIDVRVADGELTLEVADNGIGLDASTRRTGGNGLANIASRASLVGGRSHLRPRQDRGTVLVWAAPT